MSRTSLHHHLLRISGARTIALIIGLIVLIEGLWFNPSLVQANREVAPDFHVSSLDGTHFSNFKLEGEQALIMFWAPWCSVCQKELPKLTQYFQDDLPNDLQVLTIGTSASRQEVVRYVNEHPKTFVFPTAYDANKTIAKDFHIRLFPTYVLLDGDGTILLVHRGSGILNNRKFHQLTR